MQIFLDDQDYLRFLGILEHVVDKFAVQCWNYCIMPNHYHLALYPTLPNISSALQEMNGLYGQWWNGRHGRVGHVIQGRPTVLIVDTAEYLLTLSRYIARNPVRARLTSSPEEWQWSAYAATVGLAPARAFLAVDTLLGFFGTDPNLARMRYGHFVLGPGDAAAEERIRSNKWILGDAAFKRTVAGDPPLPADAGGPPG